MILIKQTWISRQRDNGKSLDCQISSERFRVADEEGVDEAEKLHHSFVLSQVFVALQQEHVGSAVAASDAKLSGSLFWRDDLNKGITIKCSQSLSTTVEATYCVITMGQKLDDNIIRTLFSNEWGWSYCYVNQNLT